MFQIRMSLDCPNARPRHHLTFKSYLIGMFGGERDSEVSALKKFISIIRSKKTNRKQTAGGAMREVQNIPALGLIGFILNV